MDTLKKRIAAEMPGRRLASEAPATCPAGLHSNRMRTGKYRKTGRVSLTCDGLKPHGNRQAAPMSSDCLVQLMRSLPLAKIQVYYVFVSTYSLIRKRFLVIPGVPKKYLCACTSAPACHGSHTTRVTHPHWSCTNATTSTSSSLSAGLMAKDGFAGSGGG